MNRLTKRAESVSARRVAAPPRAEGFARKAAVALLLLSACLPVGACKEAGKALSVTPRSLRDVPAERLAFRFEPDAKEETLPERLKAAEAEEPLASVKADFEGRRGNTEALIRTVLDPTGQRALVLYGTNETETDFRIDLYSAEGQFIRNVLPKDLTGVFPAEVAWSPDGQSIAFVGIRNPALAAAPTPPPDTAPPLTDPALPDVDPNAQPSPAAPLIAAVPVFKTEQVYVGDRDGFNLRPLTSREGLIYFQLAWSPDGQSLAALACKEDEWAARRAEGRAPAGRPRVITLEGQERLLDDRLTDVAPAWSPDGSKVATAFDYDVAVYDAAGSAPTGAAIPLREPMQSASADYDARLFNKGDANAGNTNQTNGAAAAASPAAPRVLNSFNPFVRVEWVEPETLLAQTAFVRFYRDEPVPVTTYARWHVVKIYPQAAVVK